MLSILCTHLDLLTTRYILNHVGIKHIRDQNSNIEEQTQNEFEIIFLFRNQIQK